MDKATEYNRPPFEEALSAWQAVLRQRGFATDVLWIFEENLCIEKDATRPSGFRLGYQTALTPPPTDAHHIAYDQFREVNAPLVWYRLGSSRDKSVCLLLCDPWFNDKTESQEFVNRAEWRTLFRPGTAEEVEEITDRSRWENRMVRERPLPELNFAMSLRSVHEVLAHGRVLTAYERYALKLLHVWRHWLGEQN
jgi:hypothetical protein